ncbi:MAG: LysR family transcriptional regulator [Sphingopyxis sp.]
MLDLQRLRYFVAVAEEENVGRAAERLHLTQSPLSRQIQSLEADLGLALFHRAKKRLRLTAAGQAFLVEAKSLLAHGDRVEQQVRAIAAGSAGTLAIGYVPGAIHAGVLTRWLRAFRMVAPDVDIMLKKLRSAEQERQLRAGEIDIGFAHARPALGARLSSRAICRESFKLAVPSSQYGKAAPTARELHMARFIALPGTAAAGHGDAFFAACAAAGFEPDIRYEAADPLAALEMVDAGLGFAIVQASLESIKPQGVALVDLPPGFDWTMTIHLLCGDPCSPVAAQFFGLNAGAD